MKLTDLATLTGALIATNDKVSFVDVSDTSTAPADANGSNKEALVSEFAIALVGTGWFLDATVWNFINSTNLSMPGTLSAQFQIGTKVSFFNNGATGYGYVSAVTAPGTNWTGVTSVFSTDIFTFSSPPSALVPIYFTAGLASTGLSLNTLYWPVNVSGNTCKLSATFAGTAIDITGANDTAAAASTGTVVTLGTGSTALVSGAVTVTRYSYQALPQGFSQSLARLSLGAAIANPLATDTLWDAAGDIVVGSGADTGAKITVGTTPGQALHTDPSATNKLAYDNPFSNADANLVSGNGAVGTYPRAWTPSSATAFTPVSGTLYLVGIALPKGFTITNVFIWAGTTAGATLTHSWAAVFTSNHVQHALSSDITTAAWTASTFRQFVMTAPYQTTTSGLIYIGFCVAGTTPPTIEAATGLLTTGARAAANKLNGSTADTGLLAPATAPSTAGTITGNTGSFIYAEVS